MICNIVFNGPDPANPNAQGPPLTVTLPPALMTTAVAALCDYGGYQAQVPDPANPHGLIPNPVGPATFAVQQTIAFWQEKILLYARKQDAAAAQNPNQAAATAGLAGVTVQ